MPTKVLNEPRLVGDIPTIWARRDPTRVALRDKSGVERTYAELEDRTTRIANGLLAMGLTSGDRIATWMDDCFEYVEVYLAAAKAGMIISPINARLTPAEATYLLVDSDPRILIWTADLDEKVGEIDDRDLGDRHRLRIDPGGDCQLARLIATSSPNSPSLDIDPASPLILGYTSGTTGRPKGAILTHEAILALGRINATSYRMTAYPRVALTGSMSFVAVVPAHVLCTLRLGGCLTMMGKWTVDELLTVLERDLITFTYVPSPLITDVTRALAQHPQAWTNLRSVLHSASRARPDQLHELVTVIGTRLVEGWGMTENSGGLMTAMLGHEYLDSEVHDPVFTSVGLPALDISIRVVGPEGGELPHDGESIGELAFSGPSMMTGYWNRPEETANTLRDGWFFTGDLGSIDAAGYVYISDRRTDLIVSGGANVYPSEVEDCISQLAGVREVAVVGVPHERWGQTVIAAIVVDDDAVTQEVVLEHCRKLLAGYKKPTRVLVMESLPRTASLKISRAAVRAIVHEHVERA
jgi:acyl-CoA synthetase (AMP-forming)/AMP-acid ligase II